MPDIHAASQPGTRTPRVPRAGVQRIAVFRALMLGDMLCAVPALRALRRGYPKAAITLVGLPWCREFAEHSPHVDSFIAFPGFPGLPEANPVLDALPGFLLMMQARRFDLVLQLHGSGRLVNSLVAAFGAAHTATFCEADDFCPEPALRCPWPHRGHEIERLLALTDHLGLERAGMGLEFPFSTADVQHNERLLGPSAARCYVCMHPGAQLPSRRWPAERFAAVARALARHGWPVVITGTASEKKLAQQIAAGLPNVHDLTGQTTLPQLGALVSRARLVIGNDTSISHVAAAVGTRSVIISSGADAARWAPLRTDRHRVLWADAPCRPCGYATCPSGHECATAISPAQVVAAVAELLRSPVGRA
jgi:ADP-heptose:LPS heptosyltransferase